LLVFCPRISLTSKMLAQVRNLAAIKACHDGPGVFNDFEFLFDPVARSRCTASTLCAYEAKFQSIFRVTVDDWKFIRKHTAQDLQRRQDGRGRPPISTDLVMSTALLFLHLLCALEYRFFYFSPFAGSALSIAMLCDGLEGLATTSTGMLHTHCDPG